MSIIRNGRKINPLIKFASPSPNAVLKGFSPQCGHRGARGDICAPQVRQVIVFLRLNTDTGGDGV